MLGKLSQRLYLRIWATVVGMLVVVAVVSAWGWRAYIEHERSEFQANPPSLPSREIVIRSPNGEQIAHGESKPGRKPGEALEFEVLLPEGREIVVQLQPRPRPGRQNASVGVGTGRTGIDARPAYLGPPPPGVVDWRWMPKWAQPPYSFIWMLLLVSLAIAVAAYPVARTLTRRLEKLRDGVRKFGEGDLSARVLVKGRDEVGYLAEQFNASAQRVQQLIEAQKSLLANASHELRSPLARIRMGMEIMNTGSATPETVDRTRVEIERSIKELDQLIEEILLASKLDALGSGKGVDIGSVELVEMAGLCAEECARVGAELELAVGVVGISVQGHRRLLVRLVRNLLENATRYSQGAIVLRLRKLEPRCDIEIQICDQGQGVPREHRERIFEPFYRLPGASEREGGIGLGLALVKSIALQHQGTVVCEDRPDGAPGACFTVTLPHV